MIAEKKSEEGNMRAKKQGKGHKNSFSVLFLFLFVLSVTTQAQTSNSVASNSPFIQTKGERQDNRIDRNDSLCFRSDIEVKTISKKKVPEKVKEGFNNNFQNTKNAQWRIDLNVYAVDFKSWNKEHVSAYFNSEGKMLEFITLKENKTLDAALLKGIDSQFPNSEVKEILEVTRPNANEIFYVVNISKDGMITQHYIDATGNVVE